MKKILFFILIIVSINGLSQDFPGVQSMSNPTTRLIINGGLDAKKGMINGNYVDTTAANAGFIDFHHGAQIWTTSDKNLWLRDSVLNMWVRMAKFSEVGGTDTHFGNTNLTQTADREYAGAGFNYLLDNLGNWTFQPASGKSFYWSGFGANSNFLVDYAGSVSFNGPGSAGLNISSVGVDLNYHADDYYNMVAGQATWNVGGGSGFSRIRLEQTGGSRGFDITGYNAANDAFAQVSGLEGILSLWAGREMIISADDSILFDLEPSGQTPLRFEGLPLSDTASYVMGLTARPDGRYRAVLQNKSLLGGSTPTLQQVTTAGNITTVLSEFNGGLITFNQNISSVNTLTGRQAILSNGDVTSQNASSWQASLRPDNLTAHRAFHFPNYAGTFAVHPTISGQAGKVLAVNGGETALEWIAAGGGGGGTVTDFIFTDQNGFNGTVTSSTTTPTLSLAIDNPSFEDWYTTTDEMFQNFSTIFHSTAGGAGSSIYQYVMADNIPDGWAGAVNLNVGTTSAGNAGCYISVSAAGPLAPISLASTIRASIGYKLQIHNLSDGTDTYIFSCGFADGALAPTSASNGVYFEYTHSLNSGNWTCTTESGGTKTQTNSGVAVAINTDYDLEVTVFNGEAKFYINKTLVATTSTNVPAASAQVGGYSYMYKTAGTTNAGFSIDWAKFGTRKN